MSNKVILNKLKIFFLFYLISRVLFAIDSDRVEIWQNFINNPNRVNMIICLDEIKTTMSSSEYNTKYYGHTELDSILVTKSHKNNSIFGEVVNLTENGNEFAAELLFNLYLFYAPNPEVAQFIHQYLGDFSEKMPIRFLELLDRYKPPEEHIEEYSYYCNKTSLNHKNLTYREIIKHLEIRRDLMNSIDIDSLLFVRDKYLNCINEQINFFTERMEWWEQKKKNSKL